MAAIMEAGGQVLGGIAKNTKGKYQQRIANRNANLAKRQGSASAEVQARAGEKAIGTAAARAGASGFDLSGSATDVMAQLAAEATQRAGAAIYDGDIRATAYREQGQSQRRDGKLGLYSGLASGATTIIKATEKALAGGA